MNAEQERLCSVKDCDRPLYCRGWCTKHYNRWLKYGRLDKLSAPTTSERFVAKVENIDGPGCWTWTGATTHGYGAFWWDGRLGKAHRWSWEHENGPVPEGLELDHLCRNRACVRPDHLEPVTRRENILRGTAPCAIVHQTGSCLNGHPLVEGNVYLRATGRRECRTCSLEWSRRARLKRKQAAA